MEYVLIQFRSRSQSTEFATILQSYRVQAMLVNTPRQIISSCSLSVRTNFAGLEQAKLILKRRKFDSFQGIYQVMQRGLQLTVTQIA